MAHGFPDWTWPMVWVLQEGELWPIADWVSRQGEQKHWRIRAIIGAMAYAEHTLYTVPAGKKVYVAGGVYSSEGATEHSLKYSAPVVYMDGLYLIGGGVHQTQFVPPEPLLAGKNLIYGIQNVTGGALGYQALIRAWEMDV